jgi:hypothetical protein
LTVLVLLKVGADVMMIVSDVGDDRLTAMAAVLLHASWIETVVLREVFRDKDAEELSQD